MVGEEVVWVRRRKARYFLVREGSRVASACARRKIRAETR